MTRKPFARQLQRVRRICLALPDTVEKISHGEPTFFATKRVFAMFANNHHHDGHVAVWLPASPGLQEVLIEEAPATYYRPPYVGGSGWIGIELDQISDEVLAAHIRHAWQLITDKGRKRQINPVTALKMEWRVKRP
jgi:hypothetical protein